MLRGGFYSAFVAELAPGGRSLLYSTVQYAGLVAVGEYQFNIVAPSTLANGDQSITATYNGQSTQAGTLITVHN